LLRGSYEGNILAIDLLLLRMLGFTRVGIHTP